MSPETTVKTEYEFSRNEIERVQDCITEYMKVFYTVLAAFGGVIILIYRFLSDKSTPSISLDHAELGAIALYSCIIILFFSTILFHKFNTHNRYAGYARAVTMDGLGFDPKFQVWELCLYFMYRDKLELNDVKLNKQFSQYQEFEDVKLFLLSHEKIGVFNKSINFITSILLGYLMMFTAPIKIFPTKSWTYPLSVSSSLFIITALLFIGWLALTPDIFNSKNSPQMIVAVYIFLSWSGMAYRIFRLCGLHGDRTIDWYTYNFIIARARSFDNHRIPYPWERILVPK